MVSLRMDHANRKTLPCPPTITCDAWGKSGAKDVVVWLKTASQVEAKIAAHPGQKLGR